MLEGPARPLTPAETRRARLLVTTRRRATGLLVVVAAVFIVSTALQSRAHWLDWVQAGAIASLVGGLADWFAVTALFRRPLGLPIPHTAIVVERKDRFAETLGSFVQESFLSPAAVTARLRAANAVPRAAGWLADEDQAGRLSGQAAELLIAGADAMRDADVLDALDSFTRRRLDQVTLSPIAGRALAQLTRDGRHEPVMDAALAGLSRYIAAHGPSMHRRLGVQSPWWLPGAFSKGLVTRLLARSQTLLADMAADRRHPLRVQLEDGLVSLADRLQHDPALIARGEELKGELLAQPTVRDLAGTVWEELKSELKAQAADPGSELRRRLAGAISAAGQRIQTDPALRERVQSTVEQALTTVLDRFDEELVALVTGTIARWDAEDTSRRLELLLGPDLQYIRINGTVFGGLAGLALHAVATAF